MLLISVLDFMQCPHNFCKLLYLYFNEIALQNVKFFCPEKSSKKYCGHHETIFEPCSFKNMT